MDQINAPATALVELFAGKHTKFVTGIDSAIGHKQSQPQLVVTLDSVAGDWQVDRKNHGGQDRVLHHFPRQHYEKYRQMGLISSQGGAAMMGENISTLGLDETDLHIGDIVQIGEVLLQVTQPRSPCFKLNLQFGVEQFALTMQQTALCGWFYRVLTPGTIEVKDELTLVERRSTVSLAEAMRIYFLPEFDGEQYQQLLDAEGLAQDWCDSLQRRLEKQAVEDWQRRLYG